MFPFCYAVLYAILRAFSRVSVVTNDGAKPCSFARLKTIKKTLTVHAAELAVKSCLQILRRDRRSLPLGLEQAHRSAVKNHVYRPSRLGSRRSLNLRIGIRTGDPCS